MLEKKWLYVALTSFFELVWIYGFNVASSWWHWLFIGLFIFIDFHYLTKACEQLPTGTVYAIFAGVGTVGTSLMDVFLFGGSLNSGKIIFILIIVVGVIGLNLADMADETKRKKGLV